MLKLTDPQTARILSLLELQIKKNYNIAVPSSQDNIVYKTTSKTKIEIYNIKL